MKKEERLHRLFGDIDDDLVADAAAKPIPLRVWLPRIIAAVAAVALTVGILLTQPWANEKPPVTTDENGGDGNGTTTTAQQNVPEADRPGAPIHTAPAIGEPSHVAPPRPTGGATTTTAEGTPDIWYEQKWDEKPIWMKFPDFERFEKGTYAVHDTTIDAANVGEYLQDVNLHGYDIYTETGYDVVGKIYRIKGINEFAAVALQYPDRSDFFLAFNWKYIPDTLGDLINDLNLRENIRIGEVQHSYRDKNYVLHDFRYSGLTVENVWELLMSDTSTPGEDNNGQIEWNDQIILYIDIPLFGYYNYGVYLTEEGYMCPHLVNSDRVFFIGEDKVDAFLEYVQDNCRLEEELTPLPGDTTAHNDTTMTSPAQPPLTTGTTAWKKPPV